MATNTATKAELAGRLRQLIEHSGLKQADVARRLGENSQWLSARVLGKHELTGVDIVRIAAALGVSPCAFFEEVKPEPQVVELSDRSVERIAVELAHVVAPATAEAVVRKMRESDKSRAREIAHRKTAELARRWEELSEEEQAGFWEWLEEQQQRPAEEKPREKIGG